MLRYALRQLQSELSIHRTARTESLDNQGLATEFDPGGAPVGREEQPLPPTYGAGMRIRGVIFDLGSTLIYRTGLELEQEKCGALATFARANLEYGDPERLTAHLLKVRLDGWRRSEEEG